MDWNRAREEERAALKRIVALLLAFAGLAELASSRSPAVRGFVVWILRHAEAVARDFVTGPALPPLPLPSGRGREAIAERVRGHMPSPYPREDGSGVDSYTLALRLAACFRALASQLDQEARLLLAFRGDDGGEAQRSALGRPSAMRDLLGALSQPGGFAGRTPPPAHAPDTS